MWLPLVHQAIKDHQVHLDPKEMQESQAKTSMGPQDLPESQAVLELKENQENQEYQVMFFLLFNSGTVFTVNDGVPWWCPSGASDSFLKT